jgi:16S rRNA (cytosine1402-N4)-methyltransferase
MINKKVFHIPVLLDEVIEHLNPRKNQNFIDCTIGFSGHAEEILRKTFPQGKLLAIDLDEKAIEQSRKKLEKYGKRCEFAKNNYSKIEEIVKDKNFKAVNGILFDFGLSSYQLEDMSRGFSYKTESKLDMSFGGETSSEATYNIINYSDKGTLKSIFRKYGELNNFQSEKLAKAIIEARKIEKIKTTQDFKSIILKTIPAKFKKESILSRIFQALRIETNQELENIVKGLRSAVKILQPGGRIACISYHSLEDRIVKNFFKKESKDCLCPDEIPECRCNHKAIIKIITKKPVTPKLKEIERNKRSRSAKMRVAEKIFI